MEASEILRSARGEAGLTLRRLAQLSGVAESRISDYEHGRHNPSVAMLQRLLVATGHELIGVTRSRVDPERNGRVFADVLSVVDAIPFESLHRRSGRARRRPPTWAELIGKGRSPK